MGQSRPELTLKYYLHLMSFASNLAAQTMSSAFKNSAEN